MTNKEILEFYKLFINFLIDNNCLNTYMSIKEKSLFEVITENLPCDFFLSAFSFNNYIDANNSEMIFYLNAKWKTLLKVRNIF